MEVAAGLGLGNMAVNMRFIADMQKTFVFQDKQVIVILF